MPHCVLIFADACPPDFAPRMGYLCKYLVQNGWKVHVLVSEQDPSGHQFGHLAGFGTVHRIPRKKHSRFDDLLLKIKQLFIGYAIPFADEKGILAEADRIIAADPVSLVFATSYTTYPLPLAAKTARKHKLPLIADLRDIQEEWPRKNWRYRLCRGMHLWYERYQRNKVLRQAAAVITVSPWHQQFISQINPACRLIYNGFDPELFRKKEPERSAVFRIVYTGTIGSLTLRSPDFLFAAVRRLKDQGKITPENLRIEFYCEKNGAAMLFPLSEKYGIRDFVRVAAYRPQSEVPALLSSAQLLLLLANCSSGSGSLKGVMTTKFFEYLAVNRPVLLTRSDEDCLEQTVQQLHAGVAARTEDDAYDYLACLLDEWRETGVTKGTSDMTETKRFSRQSEADEFIELFQKTIGEKQ